LAEVDFRPETLKTRFWELNVQRDALLAESAPLRAELEAVATEMREKEETIRRKIKAIEEPLYNIDMERGMLARALGGKTGENPNSGQTPAEEPVQLGVTQEVKPEPTPQPEPPVEPQQ
jgi:hypothetical protein